jgi:hypothetical protein
LSTTYQALGAISGTSMDGIDVALIATDGRQAVTPRAGATYPYPAALREELQAIVAAPAIAESAPLDEIEAAVTRAHGDAIARFLGAMVGLVPPVQVLVHSATPECTTFCPVGTCGEQLGSSPSPVNALAPAGPDQREEAPWRSSKRFAPSNRWASEIGRLSMLGELTPRQTSAAYHVGEIYGRFEWLHGRRRSAASSDWLARPVRLLAPLRKISVQFQATKRHERRHGARPLKGERTCPDTSRLAPLFSASHGSLCPAA